MSNDVFTAIRQDHDRVRALLAGLAAAAGDDARRAALLGDLVDAVSQHDAAEEAAVWPAARAKGLEALVFERRCEEHGIREELAGLARTPPGAAGFDGRLARLRASVEAHMDGEEGRLLPDLESVLSDSERGILVDGYARARDAGPAWPHPMVPAAAPLLDVTSRVAAPLDRARGRRDDR